MPTLQVTGAFYSLLNRQAAKQGVSSEVYLMDLLMRDLGGPPEVHRSELLLPTVQNWKVSSKGEGKIRRFCRLSPKARKKQILEYLQRVGEPQTCTEIHKGTTDGYPSVNQALKEMLGEGMIQRVGNKYIPISTLNWKKQLDEHL